MARSKSHVYEICSQVLSGYSGYYVLFSSVLKKYTFVDASYRLEAWSLLRNIFQNTGWKCVGR